ncbi:MAG: four helix bundle protein [Terriglobales bacterium]
MPSNIAEGQGRVSRRDFRHFLAQARGSITEVETQLVILANLGYLDQGSLDELQKTSNRIKRMLYRLMKSLEDVPVVTRAASQDFTNGKRGTGNGER